MGEDVTPPTTTPEDSGARAKPLTSKRSEVPDLVTLSQAAAMVKRSKRTLEGYKTKGKLPAPVVDGGGGKPDQYDWKEMRPWLAETFGIRLDMLPEVHPQTAALRQQTAPEPHRN